LSNDIVNNPPTANPDVSSTPLNTPTTLNVLGNDVCNNGNGCVLSNPTITDQPNNGAVTVNSNGTITYTPNPTFAGIDTFYYRTCDNQISPKCDTAIVVINVNPLGSANSTIANDDYKTTGLNTVVSGNVLSNDTDPEGNTQSITPVNVTTAQGTLIISSNGDYSFTPTNGFVGPTEYTYTVCDNGTPGACDTATLHLLVIPPDVTPNITISPNVLHGISPFNVTIKVTELNKVSTDGTITVRVPKDSRVTFTYNPSATTIGLENVNNSQWTYNGSNPFFHVFSTTQTISSGSFSMFGFVATFDPLNTDGAYNMTSTISSGSGAEIRTTNNSDSESADYFHN